MTRKEPPCICVWRWPREGEGGQRGMLCKQPGFIISSQVTFTKAGGCLGETETQTETPSSQTVEKQTGKES